MFNKMFAKAQNRVEILNDLHELNNDVVHMGLPPESNDARIYDYAVKFFNRIAMFQDKYPDITILKTKGKDGLIELNSVQGTIDLAGRTTDGYARSGHGKKITLDNIWMPTAVGKPYVNVGAAFRKNPNNPDVMRAMADHVHALYMPLKMYLPRVFSMVPDQNNIFTRMFPGNEK